eukprot:6174729-Pleurochrysis_carterae.AAC.1
MEFAPVQVLPRELIGEFAQYSLSKGIPVHIESDRSQVRDKRITQSERASLEAGDAVAEAVADAVARPAALLAGLFPAFDASALLVLEALLHARPLRPLCSAKAAVEDAAASAEADRWAAPAQASSRAHKAGRKHKRSRGEQRAI